MAFASIAGAENPGKRSFKPVPPPFDQKLNAEWGQFLPIKEQGSKPGTSDPTYSRTLKGFYSRRQYPGSPPYIPHETVGSSFEASANCNVCHNKGGYVKKFAAYAPVTPHPERVSCRQCHVPLQTGSKFVAHDWKSVNRPKIKQAAIAGGPPPIPHSLHDRGNCASCHSGPAAVSEVRTTHPERIHCRQCHMAVVH